MTCSSPSCAFEFYTWAGWKGKAGHRMQEAENEVDGKEGHSKRLGRETRVQGGTQADVCHVPDGGHIQKK